ncbi:tRNA 2-thiouridine(34) synthase MnmA [Clostridiaceae bacterium M8S5]|nr:tRNA 2-thiouridine(34) synthase MnmA [Clostridiaceae bacterium M8S5]
MKLDKNIVVVGLSGGVDSTATAYLLKKKGYNVIGLTMKLHSNLTDTTLKDAEYVAKVLDIPHHIVDLTKLFKERVIDYFSHEYSSGRTPNPCVQCNKYIKYDEFIKEAKRLKAHYVATGHYVNIKYDEYLKEYKILKHKINNKDQTYLMYNLTQDTLKHLKYPLSKFESKEQVRELVKEIDSDLYKRKNSVGICFIGDKNYGGYLQRMYGYKNKRGSFVDIEGNILGEHNGIFNYTIGQRRGLGHKYNKKMYVIDINVHKNEIVLGSDNMTYVNGVIASDFNFISNKTDYNNTDMVAKICQWGYSIPSTIYLENNNLIVKFKQKQRAAAIGQSVVLYNEAELIGGGVISNTI